MTRIIAFEGLHPLLFFTPTYLKRGLLDRLPANRVSVWRGSFMSSGPNPMPYALSSERLVVAAHSMGGASAIAWCNRWADEVSVDLLLTLDPRPLHRPYRVPANVKRAVNFYQSGWMKGFEVEGAQNFPVIGYSHTALPFMPHLEKLVEEYL